MNFSPFYYQVQEIIRNDDDKALRNIFNDLEQREEFKKLLGVVRYKSNLEVTEAMIEALRSYEKGLK